MAHVFRPRYTRTIPKHATPCKVRGKPAVKWKVRGGRELVGMLIPGKPGRCRCESPVWWVSLPRPGQRPQIVRGYADRTATEQLMARLVRQQAHAAVGLIPPSAALEAHPRTLTDLLDRWHLSIIAEGNTERHADQYRRRALAVYDAAGAGKPGELTADGARQAVAQLSAGRKKPFSLQTRGEYLTAARAFARWAVVAGHANGHQLEGLVISTARHARTRERRALDTMELTRLVDVTMAKAPERNGVYGHDRGMAYLLAANTGFRLSELASLRKSSFTIPSKGPATIFLAASAAKNGKAATQPLPAAIVSQVRTWLAGKGPGLLWPSSSWAGSGRNACRALRRDLELAGIPPVDDRGRVVDFHALRTTYITSLARAGVSIQHAQRLARLSSPTLLIEHYTKLGDEDLSAAADRLK